MAVAAVFVVGHVLVQPSPCCPAKPAFVSLYDRPLSRVEAVLAEGDGQAFAALAQDPLLRRPAVMAPAGEFSYRAQRPVWGYLDWVASVGQPGLTGWALAGLTTSVARSYWKTVSRIESALAGAREGDVVVIAGKGADTEMELADRRIPFDDRVVAREALA